MSSYHYDEGKKRGEDGEDDPFGIVDTFIHALTKSEKREWMQGWRDGLSIYRHEQLMQAACARDDETEECEDLSDLSDDSVDAGNHDNIEDRDIPNDETGIISIPRQEYYELKKIEAKVCQDEQMLVQKIKTETDEIWRVVRSVVAEIEDIDAPFRLFNAEHYTNTKLKYIRECVSEVSIKRQVSIEYDSEESFWEKLPARWPESWDGATDLKFYCERAFYERFVSVYQERAKNKRAQQEAKKIELWKRRNELRRCYTIIENQIEWQSEYELCFTVDTLMSYMRKRHVNLISTYDNTLKDKVARCLCLPLGVGYDNTDIYIAEPPSRSAIWWANRGAFPGSDWKVMIIRLKNQT